MLRERDEQVHDEVVARIPEASLDAIVNTGRTGWIPIEHDHHLPDALVAVLGNKATAALVAEAVLQHTEAPILKTMISGAIRLFGLNPASLVKVLPRAWSLVYRDFFTLEVVDREDTSASLKLIDIHPEVFRYPNYFVTWDGIFDGIFALTKADGMHRLALDEETRSGTWRLEWG